MSNTTFIKTPNAVLDYQFDWSDWLDTGETIISYVITVGTGITKGSSSEALGKVTVWLSGGTAREKYSVTCKIGTSNLRTDERTIDIIVEPR